MTTATAPTATVHRIEVRPRPGAPDVRGASARRDAASLGIHPLPEYIEAARVYLVQGELSREQVERLAHEVLADAVTEEAVIGASPPRGDAIIEIHPHPGVMDPDAEPIELAIRTTLGVDAEVRTGQRFDFHGADAGSARMIAERSLANAITHAVHDAVHHPRSFERGHARPAESREVPLLDLDDAALEKLSRDAHLFLSLDEMHAIQNAYREEGRNPREIELETLAQTWSEHCVHKTLKATIRYRGELPDAATRPGHERQPDGTIIIHNLLKSTVAAATHELIADGIDWCLSVFVDNAGIIAFDDDTAVCFKVETHNHPSALEPYGGAATGIGGCIRDIIGTGLAARPIAATDVFCVAYPDGWTREPADGEGRKALPAGCLHPRRILRQVVAGVRDYGNRMGIPTLNGAVWFDDDYVGNPLVYCGCVGVMPRWATHGDPRAGDRIIALGGRTGRDGIHGATFSSSELTDAHAEEFSHAVQIGNAVTEKKVLDAILAARAGGPDGAPLYTAITDCGAGGFSSAVGEMGETLGAEVHLERAPLKYEGLTPTEIWISEAQERMVLAVPPANIDAIAAICARHDVEWCELGHFGTEGRQLVLSYDGREMGRLAMDFLHGGLPVVIRDARWERADTLRSSSADPGKGDILLFSADGESAAQAGVSGAPPKKKNVPFSGVLEGLLGHANIASKHWVVRQYDHEVQGGSVVKPLVGPGGDGPGDAAVILPVERSSRGLAIGNGLATGWRDDPYLMALAAIDECVRNLVCVGADPERIAILDNFCWPGCRDAEQLGTLVRAAAGCYDGAKAYRTPFISGKDSLNNQFATEDGRTIRIPPTLLISGFGIVPDVARCVTMDLKMPGNLLLAVGRTSSALGGAHVASLPDVEIPDPALPAVDLEAGPAAARAVYRAIRAGLVRSAHDPSEGGLLVAAAEMAIASGLGLTLDLLTLPATERLAPLAACFAETPGRYLLEVRRDDLDAIDRTLTGVPYGVVGEVTAEPRVRVERHDVDAAVADLRDAWLAPLDW